MVKKILLLVVFLTVLVFIPMSKVNATQVYVGVEISRATAPGCTPGTANCPGTAPITDSNWCLPTGLETYQKTQMAVTTTASCIYFDQYNYNPTDVCQYDYCGTGYCLPATTPSTNPVSANYPFCAGGNKIWSGLLNLTNGANYKIYLYTPNFCPGYLNGYCWVAGIVNKNCCDVCSNYGLTATGGESNCTNSIYCYTPLYYDDNNCTTEAKLMGSACTGGCNTGASYSYYNSTTKECWTTYNGGSYYGPCNAQIASHNRVCACNYPDIRTGFLFPFTASF